MEFSELVVGGMLYNFKETRIMGINLGIVFLLPLLPRAICYIMIKMRTYKSQFYEIRYFILRFFGIAICGIIMSLFMIAVNDNQICSFPGMWKKLLNEIYTMVLFPGAAIICSSYIVLRNSKNIVKLKKTLLSILIGVVVELLVSYITHRYGFYTIETLLSSNVIRYIPFMLIIPLYNKYKKNYGIIYLFIAFVGMYFSMKYSSTGKLIILYILVPFIAIIILYKQNKKILVYLLILLPLVVLSLVMLFNYLYNSNYLFMAKFKQVVGLFSFGSDWLDKMPLSPKVRIAEIINIFMEYIKKPWLIFWGKGYMGSTPDYTNTYHMVVNSFSFSALEHHMGIFYSVHESFNSLWLYNGIIGLVFYIDILIKVIKNVKKTPFILIGGFWFLMVYGYSVTMSVFGIAALIVGLYDINIEKCRGKDE